MTTKLVAFDKLTMTTYICMSVLVCVQVIVNWLVVWLGLSQVETEAITSGRSICLCNLLLLSSCMFVCPSVVLFLIQHIIIYSSCVRFAAFRSEYQNSSDCNKSQSIYIHAYVHMYIHTYVFRCCAVVTLWSTEVFSQSLNLSVW